MIKVMNSIRDGILQDKFFTEMDAKILEVRDTEMQTKLRYKNQNIFTRIRFAQSVYDGVAVNVFKMKPLLPEVDKWKSFEPESRYQWKAVKKLKTVVKEQQKIIDASEEAQREEALELQRITARRDVLGKALGVGLSRGGYYEKVIHDHEFNMSKHFGITFAERTGEKITVDDDPLKSEFMIENFRGTFTLEQMKVLIDFLNGCPQAIADRLLKGKRE